MPCFKTMDFAPPPAAGAHLSFYWTMDEGGAANKVDSTAGLVWPMMAGTLAAPGLFVNGVEIPARIRGLSLLNSPSIVVSQATSKGISWWFWTKVVAFASRPFFCALINSGVGFNDLTLTITVNDAVTTVLDLTHQNNVSISEATSGNLAWALGTFHMIACTYDKVAQTINIYADAVLVATAPDALVYPDLTTSLWNLNTANPVGGTMPDVVCDELGLSLTGVLSQAQITSLFNAGAGVTWPNITPIVPYP